MAVGYVTARAAELQFTAGGGPGRRHSPRGRETATMSDRPVLWRRVTVVIGDTVFLAFVVASLATWLVVIYALQGL